MTLAGKGKQKAPVLKKPSGGRAHVSIQCYRCGVIGHRANECSGTKKTCYKCGKKRHLIIYCKGKVVTCYNC